MLISFVIRRFFCDDNFLLLHSHQRILAEILNATSHSNNKKSWWILVSLIAAKQIYVLYVICAEERKENVAFSVDDMQSSNLHTHYYVIWSQSKMYDSKEVVLFLLCIHFKWKQ